MFRVFPPRGDGGVQVRMFGEEKGGVEFEDPFAEAETKVQVVGDFRFIFLEQILQGDPHLGQFVVEGVIHIDEGHVGIGLLKGPPETGVDLRLIIDQVRGP